MGNCIETTCTHNEEEEEEEEMKNGSMRIKIVVTKEELDWVLFQMKSRDGKRQLVDVLGEIQRSRAQNTTSVNGGGWSPCLETIIESPHQMER